MIMCNNSFSYKFTPVYCEPVNLIGYITVDYLLIVYGNVVIRMIVRVIVHGSLFYMHQYTWLPTFEPDVT